MCQSICTTLYTCMQTCIKIVVHGDGGINKVCDMNLSRSFTFNMNGSYSKGLDNKCSISLKIKKKIYAHWHQRCQINLGDRSVLHLFNRRITYAYVHCNWNYKYAKFIFIDFSPRVYTIIQCINHNGSTCIKHRLLCNIVKLKVGYTFDSK